LTGGRYSEVAVRTGLTAHFKQIDCFYSQSRHLLLPKLSPPSKVNPLSCTASKKSLSPRR
jgi:hypothetical protein